MRARYTTEAGKLPINLPVGERMRASIAYPAGAQRLSFDVMVYNGAVLLRMISANRGIELPYYRILESGNYRRDVEERRLILTSGGGNCRLVLPRSWQDSGVDLLLTGENHRDGNVAIGDVRWLMDIGDEPSAIDQLASLGGG